jgi:hypothetical protein
MNMMKLQRGLDEGVRDGIGKRIPGEKRPDWMADRLFYGPEYGGRGNGGVWFRPVKGGGLTSIGAFAHSQREPGPGLYPYPFLYPSPNNWYGGNHPGNAGYCAAEEEKSGIPEITGCTTGDPNTARRETDRDIRIFRPQRADAFQ